jgi:hypothetical protein
MSKIMDTLRSDLMALNKRAHREALLAYRSLEDRLDINPGSVSFAFSMDNLERLSRFMPRFNDFLGQYLTQYRDVYEGNRVVMFKQLRRKEEMLMEAIKPMGVEDDRISTAKGTVDLVNAVNAKMYENVQGILVRWKTFVYDSFFSAIAQSWTRQRLEDLWEDDDGNLRIGSSLEGMTDAEAQIAATTERTAYLREQAKINNYTYCWNVNPMDQRTKPECINACLAGVIPEGEMETGYGFPPRYVCRCEIAYTRGDWQEFNGAINKEIEKTRIRLIDTLEKAPRQKSSWERINPDGSVTTVRPKDPERLSGDKMYKDIEQKLAAAEGMTVPEFRYEIRGDGGL